MNTENKPLLSIVIVNTDGWVDTLNCLESIHQNPPNHVFEVILVDNSIEISPPDKFFNLFPEVRMFSVPKSQGFAKNYNLGIKETRGKYVVILNNDTIVHQGALDTLVDGIQSSSNTAMAGPKLLSPNGQIQSTCARSFIYPRRYILIQLLLDPGFPLGRLWERVQSWKLSRKKTGMVQCISGACMMTTRDVISSVGTLDEDYDFYYEDIEWCHRVQKCGMEVDYIAEAEVTHIGDQSIRKVREWGKRSEYLNALRYFHKYHGLTRLGAWLIWISTLVGYIIRAAAFWIKGVFSKEQGYAPVYWRLSKWIVHQYPNE